MPGLEGQRAQPSPFDGRHARSCGATTTVSPSSSTQLPLALIQGLTRGSTRSCERTGKGSIDSRSRSPCWLHENHRLRSAQPHESERFLCWPPRPAESLRACSSSRASNGRASAPSIARSASRWLPTSVAACWCLARRDTFRHGCWRLRSSRASRRFCSSENGPSSRFRPSATHHEAASTGAPGLARTCRLAGGRVFRARTPSRPSTRSLRRTCGGPRDVCAKNSDIRVSSRLGVRCCFASMTSTSSLAMGHERDQ